MSDQLNWRARCGLWLLGLTDRVSDAFLERHSWKWPFVIVAAIVVIALGAFLLLR